jgi:Cu/Ag efflux protein CusF
MKIQRHWQAALAILIACVAMMACQSAFAADDVASAVSGVVKHIDKDTKTMVVKAGDGTEHTIKYTEKTSWEGTKDAGKGIKEGSKVTVHYTETGGEKTATAVKDATKDTGKELAK